MKIINLVLIFFFFNFALSSDLKTITIEGGIVEDSVICELGTVNFKIPVSTENIEGTLTMNLPLLKPEGAQVTCVIDIPPTEQQVASGDEFLFCSVKPDSFFYKNTLSFYTNYDFTEMGIEVAGWDTYFGQDATIALSISCPDPKWEFTKLTDLAEQCDTENPGYHVVQFYGSLNEEATELRFNMPLLVNNLQVSASCVIWQTEANSGDVNSALKCLFLGDGTLQVPYYMANLGNDYVYIEATNVFELQQACSTSSSSWLSLSSLLLFAIFLL